MYLLFVRGIMIRLICLVIVEYNGMAFVGLRGIRALYVVSVMKEIMVLFLNSNGCV